MTFYFIFIFGRRFAFVFGNDIKTFLTGTNFTVTLSVRLLVVCYEFLISSVPIIVYTLHSKLVFVSFFFWSLLLWGVRRACVFVSPPPSSPPLPYHQIAQVEVADK